MFDTFKNRLEITGILTTITALRISAGRSTEPIGTDLPVIKDALGQPLIPGSSFKGALRSRLESFLRGIDDKFAANPAIEKEWSITSQQMKELKESFDNDQILTQEIINKTDLISRLFGSPWIASKFQVRDFTVVPDTWFGQYQERDGVSIDRDTETAADGKLYDFQVVPASTQFEFRAVVENAEDWELGLLMIGLHQFETEQIPLGGGRSRGLGVVKLNIDKMLWVDVEDNPQFLLQYLQKMVMGDATAYEDAADYKDEWVHQFIEYLNKNISQKTSTTTTAES
ncbi:type III CRISPR-associated RAMP protein Csx7 [Dolichospermum heterosporum]|uniref:CRISPR-associated RAMP protein Csx7 n=1 Tax=Dolichospermum heterosporum TAC447 TaxID=747523 RepID=A0ABY5LXT5_9CYAN|nr:CRISPR-associated RAMP protein Csx7 [Dolichospermum heterosporum]UUO16833.1 CRISPR-associated RAMP protein Csx7 [Dolichospermum heterosporum TAC447]